MKRIVYYSALAALLLVNGCGTSRTVTVPSAGKAAAPAAIPSTPLVAISGSDLVSLAPTERTVRLLVPESALISDSWSADHKDTVGGASYGSSSQYALGTFASTVYISISAHPSMPNVGELPNSGGDGTDGKVMVRGHPGLTVQFKSGGAAVNWIESNQSTASISSATLTIDELIELAASVEFPALDDCLRSGCSSSYTTRGTAQARAAGAIPNAKEAPYIEIE
jgi:hypothetical protein